MLNTMRHFRFHAPGPGPSNLSFENASKKPTPQLLRSIAKTSGLDPQIALKLTDLRAYKG
jgi:hypothetical protein